MNNSINQINMAKNIEIEKQLNISGKEALDLSKKRLADVFGKLESVIDDKIKKFVDIKSGENEKNLQAQILELQSKNKKLEESMSMLSGKYENLQTSSTEVLQDLDSCINHIEKILER